MVFRQVVATVLFISGLVLLHFWLMDVGFPDRPGMVLLGFFLGVITYSYVMIGLTFRWRKDFLYHGIWEKLPLLTLSLAVVSFILFVFTFVHFYNNGVDSPFVFLLGIVCFVFVYFLFMLALVHLFSEKKERVVHRAYLIAIIPIVLALFVF